MSDPNTAETIRNISVWVLPVLFAIPLHEAAHGYAAWKLGDDTAYRQGRISLNQLRHIDPFGTILLPAMLFLAHSPFRFGYAKPVPVNFGRLRHPRRDTLLVAAAGPATNLAIALISASLAAFVIYLPGPVEDWMNDTLIRSILLNVILAVFNMIPLPPLDGGRVAVSLLPQPLSRPLARLERYGILILLGLLILPTILGPQLGFSFDVLGLLNRPIDYLFNVLLSIAEFPHGVLDRLLNELQ